MGKTAPELFLELRGSSLTRLLESRGAIDQSYETLDPAAANERFELLFDRFGSYLVDNDADRQRRFIRRWLALRLGEGRSPESVMHALVATIDALIQAARNELSPDAETLDLVCALQRMSYVTARSVCDVLAEDFARKTKRAAAERSGDEQ